jgi:2OG-Fe(II) oxygenase superfamily
MVMFDFLNTETPEYRRHSDFVDISTNTPKRFKDLDKSIVAREFTDNIKPASIFIKDQLLSRDECEYLVWLAETVSEWPSSMVDFWDQRNIGLLTTIPKHMFASVATAKLVLGIYYKTKEFLSKSFGVECYCDQMGLVRWPSGSFQMPHIDNVPNMSRFAGCVIYLNDDYDGGVTYYPFYDRQINPLVGRIFAHDSGESHSHGVTKISTKTRYTISSTWSTDPKDSNYEAEIQSLTNYINNCSQPELPHEGN